MVTLVSPYVNTEICEGEKIKAARTGHIHRLSRRPARRQRASCSKKSRRIANATPTYISKYTFQFAAYATPRCNNMETA
jgi:hypothetical protein